MTVSYEGDNIQKLIVSFSEDYSWGFCTEMNKNMTEG